ncbi:MAG: hypothetical protein EPO21_04750 [Chloroflexota bacterium]|nr:MAG: hypothetical protein EPO21_04750 [Chloroflexota bacterium]
MPTYEAGDFEPPAPVVRATIRGQNNKVLHGVPLLIDTGADISLIPLDVVDAVGGVTQPSETPIQFLDGEQINCLQSELTVEFLMYRFRGAFLTAECSYGILGRNILNLLHINLDGPNLSWSVSHG